MEGLRLLVPLIISEESSLVSALRFLAESDDEFLPKRRFRDVGGECCFFFQLDLCWLNFLINPVVLVPYRNLRFINTIDTIDTFSLISFSICSWRNAVFLFENS